MEIDKGIPKKVIRKEDQPLNEKHCWMADRDKKLMQKMKDKDMYEPEIET